MTGISHTSSTLSSSCIPIKLLERELEREKKQRIKEGMILFICVQISKSNLLPQDQFVRVCLSIL